MARSPLPPSDDPEVMRKRRQGVEYYWRHKERVLARKKAWNQKHRRVRRLAQRRYRQTQAGIAARLKGQAKRMDLCECGKPKWVVSRRCEACDLASRNSVFCECGARRRRSSARCQACSRRIQAERAARRRVCACGAKKQPLSATCKPCYFRKLADAKMCRVSDCASHPFKHRHCDCGMPVLLGVRLCDWCLRDIARGANMDFTDDDQELAA